MFNSANAPDKETRYLGEVKVKCIEIFSEYQQYDLCTVMVTILMYLNQNDFGNTLK